jgi:thiamine pyrophosphate-dependent acetolactate synthase large subunit-like protein/nitrite reductase/ring-hydroxylating ferredoxin subunit
MSDNLEWFKVLDNKNELPEGRVMTVSAGHTDVCLTNVDGIYSALTNKCPHQGGPLGEGSIENGFLRCPWHGWDFNPCGGDSDGFEDGLKNYALKVEGKSILIGIEKEVPHQQTIADVMAETMVAWGVNRAFGMVGHSNLGLADALRRQEEKGKLNFIGIRHEGAASFAASAYGKLTGKPAACFAIAGPGSTNMFTGLWDAKVDRAPILALTGQVATQVVGTGNFQELDLVRAFSSVAEFNHRVEGRSKHSELMALAIKHAILKRDVSHLTFPDEVQELVAGDNETIENAEGRMTEMTISPPKNALDKALVMLNKAKRPVIIVGHGARFHMKEIVAFAEKINSPVMTTFKGKGQISDTHPLGCGVLGRSGTPIASWFMNESDLLLVIGASFSNHTGITPKKPLVQIDFDPLALSKFHKVDAALWGEISVTVQLMSKQIGDLSNKTDCKSEVADRWSIWRKEKAKRLTEDRGKGSSSIAVIDTLSNLAPDNAIICVDVGNNAYSLGRYFESKKQTFLMSGYLGSIGFALPASIGAWAAVGNERPIIAVAGDGGLCQYLAEITTLVKYKMPVKVIVLNNNELGKISKEQRAGKFDVWATDLVNPNFADYATSCGALGIYVKDKKELTKGTEQLLAFNGPALLEIKADVGLI